MKQKVVAGIVLILLLTSILSSIFITQHAKAEPEIIVIYIRADGSVDPPTAPIRRDGNTYTFTNNINGHIVVEKDNIVIDGAGHILQAQGTEGITLIKRTNVVVRNIKIIGFSQGICIEDSNNIVISRNDIRGGRADSFGIKLFYSNNTIITENNITYCEDGIEISGRSSNNTISRNIIRNNYRGGVILSGILFTGSPNNNIICGNIIRNNEHIGIVVEGSFNNNIIENIIIDNVPLTPFSGVGIGVDLSDARHNTIRGNTIKNNTVGISIRKSSNNIIYENTIADNRQASYLIFFPGSGVYLYNAFDNKFYHNNFINNTYKQVYSEHSVNVWDDGYPSGGNYWSDYTGKDTNGDGIGDMPYVIDEDNIDHYPLIRPAKIVKPLGNQPPACSIRLQKNGVEINKIYVGEFFDIYVGDSTDDTGITQVRFSSDDSQDGVPTGEWTEWYDWSVSSGDWDASTKIKRWAFATGGAKEVWAEVKDDVGQTAQCSANIYAIIPKEKTLLKLIAEEAIERYPVTVDGQQYYILTLKSYIDPITLEPTPGVLTKVYVDTKNYTVSDPEIARKIGIIDYAHQISEKVEEMRWNKQVLTRIKEIYTTLRLTDLTIAAINIYVSEVEAIRDTKTLADALENIQTIKDLAQLKVPAGWSGLLIKLTELAMRALIYDPMKELNNDLLSELSQAIDSYDSALGVLEGGITEYSTANSFLQFYLSAEAHKDQAVYLFKKFLDNYKLFIAKLISGVFTGGLSNFDFLVKEAMNSLDWTITLTYTQIVSSYENFALLNYKLLASAKYTLELAGTPSEVIHEYAIKYDNHVSKGYELAAEAIKKIVTPKIPFFLRISVFSPVELRVYDPNGRVTGVINSKEINEIPYSIYHENTVIILSSNDSYLYEIVGTEKGSYGLEVIRVSLEENKTFTFTSSNIPISTKAIHQYTINWDTLSQGREGVTIKVDSDGDGVFELTFASDSRLTKEEFMLQTPPREVFPIWIVGVVIGIVAVISVAVFWRKQKRF